MRYAVAVLAFSAFLAGNAQAKACIGPCDDYNICTTDSCQKSTGRCVYVNNTVACDDGNPCTQLDACQSGACSGSALEPMRLVSANGNMASIEPRLSDDGRYVAFESLASTLVAGDTNSLSDVFVTDRQTGTITRVSVTGGGIQASGESHRPFISSTGRYVAFDSNAANLAVVPALGTYHALVRDVQTGTTTRASSNDAGQPGNSSSYEPSVSADGRYVAFYSFANNLAAGDTNNTWDVFVRDMQAGTTTRISQDAGGVQGNGMSFSPSISPDGRYVVFTSVASNLVVGDTNGQADIFLYDRQGNTMFRASVTTSGAEANGGSYRGRVSADGHYVTFMSLATNLVSGDTNGTYDIFLRDVPAGLTTRASVGPAGVQGDGASIRSVLTADGSYVVFHSNAPNLVFGDTNGVQDVFLFNRASGATTRISMRGDGSQSLADSYSATVSADGLYIGFQSAAANLVLGDTNGAILDAFVASRPCP